MKNFFLILALAAMPLFLTGCLLPLVVAGGIEVAQLKKAHDLKSDQKLISQRQEITTKFNNNPDTDAWYDQRQQIATASGDRIFDKDFSRVFDSLVIANGDLELKVNAMERESGYISASGIGLSPSEAKQMRTDAVNEWCKLNGYDPSVLQRDFKTDEMRQVGQMLNFSDMTSRYDKAQRGLTFQLIKMSDTQTKVKLRFSEVYYPGEVEAYYKQVWQAVDKQIFIDQNIEGGVEKRN